MVDYAGYPSAFYCTLNTHYRIVSYRKPKQLIIKDCARRFVFKLHRQEASRGLFATAELLVNISCLYLTRSSERMLSGLPMSSQPYLSSTPRSTRSSSVVTLSCHPTTSALKITDRSFRYASPRLWNQLPDSFCQRHQSCLDSSCSSSTCQPIFVIIPAHHSRPTMFNTLPDDLRYPAVSTSTFRQSLKTHLFSAYQHV